MKKQTKKPLSLKKAVKLHNLLREEIGKLNLSAFTDIEVGDGVGSYANPYEELADWFISFGKVLYLSNPGMNEETKEKFWRCVQCKKDNRLVIRPERKGGYETEETEDTGY